MLMYEWMRKVTLDIICDTIFGYKTDSLHNPQNELAVAYEELVNLQSGMNIELMAAFMVIPGISQLLASEWAYKYRSWFAKLPLVAPASILIGAMYRIKKIAAKMLQDKLMDSADSADDLTAKRDIISLLIRARMSDKSGAYHMSDAAMVDQVLTLLGAGHETTASGLAWTLWLLATHPITQTKLREEVSAVVADNPHPDYRSLKDLQWLDCVVMESLRLMPPVPMTLRRASKDQCIDGVSVPKGTIFYIPIKVVNTWKEIWGEDAEKFNPARWLDLPQTYNPTFSLLSFIAGPHACIGRTMAIMEMKAILTSVIANFEFQPAYAGQVAKPTAAVTMKPSDDMPLRVRLAHRNK
jgi:cytochrome P450